MPTQTTNSAVNQQITDSVEAVNNLLNDASIDNAKAYSHQITAHAVGLAMLNAVQQQQQRHILQNAITTAAAKAILALDPKEALSLLKENLAEDNILETLAGLKDIMNDINDISDKMKSSVNAGNKTKENSNTANSKKAKKSTTATKKK